MPHAPLLIAAALAVAVAAPAAAQTPDTAADTAADTAGQEEAPRPAYQPPRFTLSVTVGTHGFDRLQSQPVLARRRDATGAVLDSALLTRFVEAEGGLQIAASGLISLGPAWGARLGASLARTTIRPAYEGEAALFAATAAQLAPGEATAASILALEAALRMRIPSSRRAQPYLELGASAIRWSAHPALTGAPELTDGVLRLAGMAALGVEVPFFDRLAARLRASTRAFRTPVEPAPVGGDGAAGPTLTLTFADPGTGPFADGAQELVTALRLELGISLGLGGPVASPPDPAAPAASTPPTRR